VYLSIWKVISDATPPATPVIWPLALNDSGAVVFALFGALFGAGACAAASRTGTAIRNDAATTNMAFGARTDKDGLLMKSPA
jgi:hypothetical protein